MKYRKVNVVAISDQRSGWPQRAPSAVSHLRLVALGAFDLDYRDSHTILQWCFRNSPSCVALCDVLVKSVSVVGVGKMKSRIEVKHQT